MDSDVRSPQAGFSLTELLVAMLVTMIVSGAVFGLMTAGQGAFRREPELTDRQQNIRLAMDLIQRDISSAGVGMEPFEQAFSGGDGVAEAAPLLDGQGPLGPGLNAAVVPATGATANSDVLEVMGSDGECNEVPLAAAAANDVTTRIGLPACYRPNTLVAVAYQVTPTNTATRWGFGRGLVTGNTLVNVNAPYPLKAELQGNANATPNPVRLLPLQIARYAIAVDADGVPNLWRSTQGGINPADGLRAAVGDPLGGWQLIARGIEDLQVQYVQANNVVVNTAPLVNDWPLIVREVRVILWARALAPLLAGQTRANTNVGNFVRGSLVSSTTPRQALMHLRDPAVPVAFRWN
jgi:type II secretory pathway pseudopilin PulG